MKKALLPLLLVVALLIGTIPAFATESPELLEIASVTAKSVNYNGKAQFPVVTVKDTDGNVVPAGNYTVKLNKTAKNAGKYKVTVTGIGNYDGTATGTFKILKIKNPFKITAKNTLFRYSTTKDRKTTIYISGLKERSQAEVTWKTSSKRVQYNGGKLSGKLIVKKGFKGGAKIKVTASATKNYKTTTKFIRIKVF